MFLKPATPLKADERRLLDLYRRLSETERESLVAFAEFLDQRATRTHGADPTEPPRPIPRPNEESVVAALRRLSETYYMLDKTRMLQETSPLMAQHVLQGRERSMVIDELEVIFERCYQELRDGR
jgi:hypothetical protein